MGISVELHLLHYPLVKQRTLIRAAVPPKWNFTGSGFAMKGAQKCLS